MNEAPQSNLAGCREDDGLLRIWELELVISGAVIVALFQLPQVMDTLFYRIAPHISHDVNLIPFMFYYIGKLTLYPLLMTFMLHFFLRGLWVGLIGLDKIYPQGIKWKELKMAPIQEELARESTLGLKDLAEKVDRIASSLFSILFLFLIIFIWLGLLFMICAPLSVLLKATLLPEFRLNSLLIGCFYGILIAIMIPMAIAGLMDKKFKKNPESIKLHPKKVKIIKLFYQVSHYATFSFLNAGILATFKSNMKQGKATLGFFLLIGLFPCIFFCSFLLSRGVIGFNSYRYFPLEDNALEMKSQFFENLRTKDSSDFVPTVQSDMITDPYIKLFLPFRAAYDNETMVEHFPELKPYRSDGFYWAVGKEEEPRNAAILDHLRTLFQVELNGEMMQDLEFSFYTHPRTGVRGLITYLPVERAGKGKNLIRILKEKPKRKKNKDDGEQTEWFIPFWI